MFNEVIKLGKWTLKQVSPIWYNKYYKGRDLGNHGQPNLQGFPGEELCKPTEG